MRGSAQLGRNVADRIVVSQEKVILAFWSDLWSKNGEHDHIVRNWGYGGMVVSVHSRLNPTWMARSWRKQDHLWTFDFVEALPTGDGEILIFEARSAQKTAWQGYELHIVRSK